MGGLFAALILQACKGKGKPAKPKSPRQPGVPTQPAQPAQPILPGNIRPEIPYDKDIKIPKFEIIDEPPKFEKPENIGLSDEQFVSLCQYVSGTLVQGVEGFLIPEIRRDPRNAHLIMQQFLSQTAGMIESTSAEGKRAMQVFHTKWNKKPEVLVAEINKYLIPAGLFMYLGINPGGRVEIDVHKIEKSNQAKVSDGKSERTVPCYYLKEGMLGMGAKKSHGQLGAMTSDFSTFFLYNDRIEPTTKEMETFLPTTGNFANKPFAKGNWTTDIRRHETAHAFVAQQFPAAATTKEMDQVFETPLEITFAGASETRIGMSGDYPPAMFQELCGVGIQIASSHNNALHHLYVYLTDDTSHTYFLVRQIIPLALLQVAPNSPARQVLADRLLQGGALEFEDLRRFITNGSFTNENAKEVGEILYRVGYTLLRKAERGALKRKTL